MKERRGYIVYVIGMMLCVTACSVKNKLPKGTYLYKGATVSVTKTSDRKYKTGSVKSVLKSMSSPKPNKMILGYPYRVAFWYFIGPTKKNKGFKYWLRNKIGEAPVLSTTVNEPANAVNMQVYVENKGYFKSIVSSKREIHGYKSKAIYNVKLEAPYFINDIKWVLDSSRLAKDLARNNPRRALVKKGVQFDLDDIKAERSRIDAFLKGKGYYFFSPDYIKSYADSSVGDYKINLFFAIKKDMPPNAGHPQMISSVVIFPNYTLLFPPPDTSKTGLITYDSIYIRDTVHAFYPQTLVRPITYRPGSLYNIREHNKTLNRFINMGEFKFVKSRYVPDGDTAAEVQHMRTYYYLTPSRKKTISAELAGFTKTNSFTGTQLNVNWKNRNLFKGAEQLNVKAYGAFELSLSDSLRNYNNWRVGGEVSLQVPRFVVPFRMHENSYFPPYTKFTVGYEWARRTLLFTQNTLHLQYDLTWKEQANKQHTLAPISITWTKTSDYSDDYLTKINVYPGLRYTFYPELITGSSYNFQYNTRNPNAPDIFYLQANAEIAGNILGLINKPDTAYSKKIGNAYFAQYAKLDADFRYSRRLAPGVFLANRISIGLGMPYGNSLFLPFVRQYVIGGANSLRGFPPRQLGPGRVLTTADQQVTYPQIGGDYKLEMNTELRFNMAGHLKGALFAEAGNIWMRNEALYGPGSTLSSSFMKDLAADGGFGIRYDLNIILIRLDMAVPFRKPWLDPGQEWVLPKTGWGDVVFNFGIGYPF